MFKHIKARAIPSSRMGRSCAGLSSAAPIYMSEEARKALPREPRDDNGSIAQVAESGRAAAIRQSYAQSQAPAMVALVERFGLTMRETTIGGVHGFLLAPANGVPARNRGRILINLRAADSRAS